MIRKLRLLFNLTCATVLAMLAQPMSANAQVLQTIGTVDDVSIDYGELGGGIYSLFAEADFTIAVEDDIEEEYTFKTTLVIAGGVATLGPGFTTLSSGQTSTFTYDTVPNPTVSTAGQYNVAAGVEKSIAGANQWILEDLAGDSVTIPDEDM